ncbi:hypothetical protein [Hyphomonas oceanitis]|uniref:Uncharacterized protein n=1 Tax=Hyphomonas oceanitis SCH89 TaxID=1280953 RepID=A0A059GA16_9PROT|nr:hypothetical protein [Hyphomonas oceanitis]KDA03574.1 hypothetical protein HOC_03807 [Hyphomonas oceanitis SCH89]
MSDYSLFRPMQGLPWYLVLIWPVIYFRIQRLMDWFQINGAPGSQMFWGLSKTGHAVLIRASDDLSGHRSGCFLAPVSPRLRLALTDETISPCPLRRQGRGRAPGRNSPPLPAQGTRAYLLPLPHT